MVSDVRFPPTPDILGGRVPDPAECRLWVEGGHSTSTGEGPNFSVGSGPHPHLFHRERKAYACRPFPPFDLNRPAFPLCA